MFIRKNLPLLINNKNKGAKGKKKIRKNQNSKKERNNNQVVQAKVLINRYKNKNLEKQLSQQKVQTSSLF